jgi:hypothetical protein
MCLLLRRSMGAWGVPRIESGRVGSASISSSPPARETACRDVRLVCPRQKLRLIHRRKCPPAYIRGLISPYAGPRQCGVCACGSQSTAVWCLTSPHPSHLPSTRCDIMHTSISVDPQPAFSNTSSAENGMASRLPPMRRETRRNATVYLTHASRAHSNGSTCASVRLCCCYL